MKILISSKYLAAELNKLGVNDFYIHRVSLHGSELKLITLVYDDEGYPQTNSITLIVHNASESGTIIQDNRQWSWVRKLVNQVDEQPLILEITEHAVNVIFQY